MISTATITLLSIVALPLLVLTALPLLLKESLNPIRNQDSQNRRTYKN